MPWTNQTGGGGNDGGGGRSPWGRGPSGGGSSGGGNPPPDLEELMRRGQDRLRRVMPSGGFTGNVILAIVIGALFLWVASGTYIVGPEQMGIVLRFGRVTSVTPVGAGLSWHLPWPIETAYTQNVTQENQIPIGYTIADSDNGNTGSADVEEESHMLTGDENIVDVNFTVYWKVKDVVAFLFNVDHPKETIKAVAESAMRQIAGESQVERIQTSEREEVQQRVQQLMQKALDSYHIGVTVTRVQLIRADPPQEVIAAYRDVQAARADQERKRNEAEEYANKVVPRARGQAAQIVQDAQAYKAKAVALAEGESKRFNSVYQEYRKAPEVTRRRMYLETMSGVLAPMNKVVVDEGAAKGFIPYYPMPSPRPAPPPPPQASDNDQPQGGQQQ
jgi:membrane protease subunit HflK